MNVAFESTQLRIDGRVIETPLQIRDAFGLLDRVIVLLDQFASLAQPALDIREIRNAPKGSNLYCYSPDGEVLWKAELPRDNDAEDYYYRVSSRSPLVAISFSSFRCEIDPADGRIVRKEFFK